ncbi:MAG: hypothetical protein IJQ02_12010 [Oscillospiraceae bacterium]|nr:hypothetical protein [Oscillospiraceae bacterium]
MKKFEGKKLLLLGNNISTLDIIRYAQEQGAFVIVTDYVPYEKSAAKQMADDYWDISTDQIDALYERAKKEKVTAVFAGVGEFNLRSAMKLCKLLGLPFYATQEQWSILDNKENFKQLCIDNGVPVTPVYYTGGSADIELPPEKFPAIVKPVDGAGAVGISVCDNNVELRKGILAALEKSQKKQVIVEKFIQNTNEFTAHYVFQNGHVYLFGALDRQLCEQENGGVPLPVAYIWDSPYLDRYIREVAPNVEKMFHAAHIHDGVAFIQMFVDDESFYIYEMGYRLPGSQVYFFAKELYGISQLELMVDYAMLGTSESIDASQFARPYFPRPCCNLYYRLRPGKIARIEGLDEIRAMEGVLNVTLIRNVGDTIGDSKSLREVFLRAHVVGDNYEKLAALVEKMNAALHVYSDMGENMICAVLDPKILIKRGEAKQ